MTRALILALTLTTAPAATYDWGLPKGVPPPRVPPANPMSAVKVTLGRFLFYDKRLSANHSMSCATCHRQELAFTDGRATPVGVTGAQHPRSAMSLVNVAYNSPLTWSNPTVTTLEQQALVPLLSQHPVEMGLHDLTDLLADSAYPALFARAFPTDHPAITLANIAKALAAFERTIISARSPYDCFVRDNDPSAISESAKRGELLFFSNGSAACFRCHSGFNFSDSAFHNTGLYNPYPSLNTGLYAFTRNPVDIGRFRTPTLRNIALTAPYMHDGSIATLSEVLDHYAAGGRASANPHKDHLVSAFPLTPQNREDLLSFLNSLTDHELLTDPRLSDPSSH